MKRLTLPLLVILAGVTFGSFLYGPAGMPSSIESNIDNDTTRSAYFTTTDSLYWYNTNYNFYLRQAAATAGDRDIGIVFVEEDGTEHTISWDDGSSRFEVIGNFKATWLYTTSAGGCIIGTARYKQASLDVATGYVIDPNIAGAGVLNLGQSGDNDTTRVVGVFEATGLADFDVGITLAEISTPSALADHGKVYTKTDNELYFQDGAGAEHIVNVNSTDYAEMGNIYGNDATEALAIANVWYGMYHANINSGEISGFTYVDGSVGAGNITTAQAGAGINIADAAHGLVDGDIICVQSANHAGVDTVTYVDAGNFEITIAYVGDEAGTWQEGSYLEVNTAGQYRGIWNACCTQSAANAQTTIVSPFINTVQGTKVTALKYLSNANDTAAPGGNAIMTLAVGDRMWFALQSTVAQTITFKVRNVSID